MIAGTFLFSPVQMILADGLTQLKKNDQEIIKTIQSAITCMPKFESNQVRLCTGVILDHGTIARLKTMKKTTCFKEIEEHGYRVISSFNPDILNAASWSEFVNSTKRAETLQKEKTVLFRLDATVVDCIHELTHVLQYTSKSHDNLNPIIRDKRFSTFQSDVEKLADEIEDHAKKGDQAFAEKNSQVIDEHLKHLRDYWRLHETLDEKDAHLLVLFGCKNWWKCTDDDLDTAVANLSRLKDFLSPAIAAEVSEIGSASLVRKEAQAFREAESLWKKLSLKNKSLLLEIAPRSADEIVKVINKKGAEIRTKNETQELSILRKGTQSSCQIQVPNNDSQIAFEAAILFLQIENNPDLCDSLTLTAETEQQFKQGKLQKEIFETKVLGWRMNRLLGDTERTTFINKNYPHLKPEQQKRNQDKINSINEKLTKLRKAIVGSRSVSR